MSVNLGLGGIPGTPVSVTLGSSEADVFAPSASGGLVYNVIGFDIVNTDGSARVVDLYWNDGTTSYAFYKKSIPATDSLTKTDNLIPLVPAAANGGGVAKKIRGKAATGSVVVVTVYYTMTTVQK